MPRIFTTDKDKGMRAALLSFREASEIVLDIGFFPESGRHPDNKVLFSDIAHWNEEGTPEAEFPIPPRPFMRSVLDSNSSKYYEGLASRSIDKIEETGSNHFAELALKRTGKIIAADIQQSLKLWSDPGNADATVDKKGFDNPLMDFEKLQKAVQWKIRRTADPTRFGGEEELFRGGVK